LVGIGLHFGILYLQNIDFLSWWIPCYVFFFDPLIPAVASAEQDYSLGSVLHVVARDCPIAFSLGFLYVLMHQMAHVYLHCNTGKEAIPFSAFRMFCDIKDLFDPAFEKRFWLSEKPHAPGTLKNYAFPFAGRQHVTAEELAQMPFKFLAIKHGGLVDAPKEKSTDHLKVSLLEAGQQEELVGRSIKPRVLYTNLKMTDELTHALDVFENVGRLGPGEWKKAENVEALLASVTQLRTAFRNTEFATTIADTTPPDNSYMSLFMKSIEDTGIYTLVDSALGA
jgi:hypothetical protein